jgi:hypothetical protein
MWRRNVRKPVGKVRPFERVSRIIITLYQTRMSNEIREKDHEWVKAFHSNFDRLLALLEKLLEKRQPSAYGDELLTDKEVAFLLKVSRRTLQDYRNNGILPYTQVGGKILYRASDIEKTLMKGYKEAYKYKRN